MPVIDVLAWAEAQCLRTCAGADTAVSSKGAPPKGNALSTCSERVSEYNVRSSPCGLPLRLSRQAVAVLARLRAQPRSVGAGRLV